MIYLNDEGFQYYQTQASYGLNGWIVCKEMRLFERELCAFAIEKREKIAIIFSLSFFVIISLINFRSSRNKYFIKSNSP